MTSTTTMKWTRSKCRSTRIEWSKISKMSITIWARIRKITRKSQARTWRILSRQKEDRHHFKLILIHQNLSFKNREASLKIINPNHIKLADGLALVDCLKTNSVALQVTHKLLTNAWIRTVNSVSCQVVQMQYNSTTVAVVRNKTTKIMWFPVQLQTCTIWWCTIIQQHTMQTRTSSEKRYKILTTAQTSHSTPHRSGCRELAHLQVATE